MDKNILNTRIRRKLFENINILSTTEHAEIYKIIQKTKPADVLFSKNKNGVFFNLSEIDDDLFKRLDDFVSYCLLNKKTLDDYDQRINECKLNPNLGFPTDLHIKLDDLPKSTTGKGENWNEIIRDQKSITHLANYIENISKNLENIIKKNPCNTKFNMAKKKYAKQIFPEKKVEESNLQLEVYVL